jgi:RNA polymerase sigma-70 factor (ECF subfamily)
MASVYKTAPQDPALEFFEKNYQRLILAAYRMIGNLADAEDLVQDIYIQVSPRWHTIESPSSYVKTALAHRAAQVAERRSALKALLGRFTVGRQPSPSAERLAELREDAKQVRIAFRRLPERQRLIAVLHFYLEYEPGEIADELGISRQAVNTQISRVKVKLRQEFRIPSDSPLPLAKEEA